MKERNLNADLIRCAAVFCVVSVHFLLKSGFYNLPVEGSQMWLMCMVRSLFMVCVPLFMILTGYLMCHKELSRRYYGGLVKTLEIYVLASIACLLFKKFALGNTVTLPSAILDILNFKAANYSWYIEMYIGLFLMIPFLNLAYRGLNSKRQKQVLVLTMILMTMLPKMVNNFNFTVEGWWSSPSLATKYNPVIPDFFTGMYPLTYYFLGAYLREYGFSLGRKKTVLLLLLAVAVFGSYNYWRSDGQTFVWASNSTWGGENLITATLLFGILLNVNTRRWPETVRHVVVFVSKISLGLYLVSWIFDQIVYSGYLNVYVEETAARFKFYPLAVAVVFFGSMGGSVILYGIQRYVHILAGKLVRCLSAQA